MRKYRAKKNSRRKKKWEESKNNEEIQQITIISLSFISYSFIHSFIRLKNKELKNNLYFLAQP